MTIDYGSDVWCDASVKTGRYADDLRLAAQNVVHRLTTPKGALRGGEEEQDYGLDLPGMIGSAQTEADAAALPGRISVELSKDPRVLTTTTTVTSTSDGVATSWTVAITVTTERGSFRLAASEVTVELVGLGGGA